MAGATMCANNSLLLGFREHVHHAFVAIGPVSLGKAVHQDDVEVVSAEFLTEAIKIGAHLSRVARPGFGEHRDFVPRNVLERLGNVRMASIRVGGVEEAESVVVSVAQQVREALNPKCGLMRMVAGAYGSRAHGKTAGVNSSIAENDSIGSGEFPGELRHGESCRRHLRAEPGCAHSISGAGEELAALHFSEIHLGALHGNLLGYFVRRGKGAEGSSFKREKYKPVSGTMLHGRGRPRPQE